jgi:WD40 repeat protein/predicted Ser/Thr protein kinase
VEFSAVSEAFGCARRLAGDARAQYLAGLDEGLRREVEELLGHHDSAAGPSLEPPWESLAALASGAEQPPELSGFRIVRRIGAGGMGTVFEAEQLQPHRRVAIKLLHLVTEEGRRRFEREAQVLADLEHPGIAEIHAQGVTVSGDVPYLAMEYVDGVPLTTCSQNLDERARVELLAAVCDAVAHAHEHGVIHRDLKPGNILVTADGRPKVLDFGLARVLSGDSLQTRTGHVLGTLSYMSPEQALGTPHAADTRSDVYALGVIAYEMIGGRLPYDFSGLALPAVVNKLVREDPPSLTGQGDLAHIIAKAMAREKHHRYATAAGLADDLRRYLNDQTVVARAPTAGEQIGRFVRRNKALVLGLAATVLGLAVGLIFAIRFAQEATLEGARARHMAASASLQAAAAAERSGAYRSLDRHLQAVPPEERGWEWDYLARHLDHGVATVPIDAGMKFMTLSEDGSRLLAIGPTSFEARLLDTGSGATLPMELGRRAALGAGIAFAGNEPYIVAVRDKEVWLLHAAGKEALSLMPHARGRYPSVAAMSPDGSRLAWVQQFGETFSALHLHDAATGDELWTVRGGHDAVAFDNRGEQIAFSNWGGDLIVHRVPSLERVAVFRAQSFQISAIAFDPDGKQLATSSLDQTIRIWDLEAKRQVHRLRGHAASVNVLAYSPDGELLVSGGGGTLRVWSPRTGECVRILAGHGARIHSVRFRGNRHIVSAAGDGIRHWSLELPAVVRAHRSRAEGNKGPYVYGVAFSPDGTRFASAGWDKTVRLYDSATRRLLATMPTQREAYCVTFSPDGRLLAAGSRHVEIYDARTGRSLRRLQVPTAEQTQRVQFTPDGRSLLATTVKTTALLDAVTGAVQKRWKNAGTYQRAAISPDGRTVAHARARIVHLRAIQPGGRERELKGHTRNVYDLEFSPHGRWLATAGGDQTVRVWDLRTGTERFCLRGHSAIVYAVAFSPDSKRLFSGSNDATVRVWDLERGEERLELRGHDWYVFDLAVHPDGQTVASASGDNSVRLWTTHSDRELHAAAQAMRAREAKWAGRVRAFADVDAIAREPGWDDLDRAAAYNLWIEAHGE